MKTVLLIVAGMALGLFLGYCWMLWYFSRNRP